MTNVSYERQPRPRGRREGSALVITMVVLFMLMVLALVVSDLSAARGRTIAHSRERVQLLAAAEAGIGFKVREIDEAGTDTTLIAAATAVTPDAYVIDGITVRTRALDLGNNILRVVSVATARDGTQRGIEVHLASATHPLFTKSVYVGNKYNVAGYKFRVGPADLGMNESGESYTDSNGNGKYDLGESFTDANSNGVRDVNANAAESSGSEATEDTASFEEAATASTKGDFVDGDIYVNGDAEITGKTNIYGDIDATGVVDGRTVEGATKPGASLVGAPDLSAINYEALANASLGTINPTGGRAATSLNFLHEGTFSSSDSTNWTANPSDYERANFQFGKGGGMSSSTTVDMSQVDGSGSNIVLVKGNVWLESFDVKDYFLPSSGDGKKVTIVVEGNLYISDQLSYADYDKDAIVFIVKGTNDDPTTTGVREDESFNDGYVVQPDGSVVYDSTKINGKHDANEQIINDDGNGTYDGPKEGQGNIYFGDRQQTAGGITDGFMYAQNNAYLLTYNVQDDLFGVRGFFSAGGIVDMGNKNTNRATKGGGANQSARWNPFRVKGDDRIANGTISMAGLPSGQGGGYAGLEVGAWRELNPTDWSGLGVE